MIKDSLGSNYQPVGQFIYSLYLFPGKFRMLDPMDPKSSNKARFLMIMFIISLDDQESGPILFQR